MEEGTCVTILYIMYCRIGFCSLVPVQADSRTHTELRLPQHGSWRRRRLVQLLVAFGLTRYLLVDIASGHAHPQRGGQSGVVQEDPHLEDRLRPILFTFFSTEMK